MAADNASAKGAVDTVDTAQETENGTPVEQDVKIKVKPETQNGTKVKLKGKGMPVYKKENEFGDLYITYDIQIPTNLTEKQKKLFEELKEM